MSKPAANAIKHQTLRVCRPYFAVKSLLNTTDRREFAM